MDRRNFLKNTSLASLALTNINSTESSAKTKSSTQILNYRKLGNTGLKASDVSFGTSGSPNYRILLKAMDMGINYFDTSPDYGSGRSESELGKAIKFTTKKRDELIIATKLCSTFNHLSDEKKNVYISHVEASLKRLGTDYIDFLLIHALSGSGYERLKDSNMLEAVEKLKKDGKVRFLGVSSHNYTATLDGGFDYAINSGQFNLIMPAYSFLGSFSSTEEYLPDIIKLSKKAEKKGVAFVAMKTLDGAKGIDESKLKGRGTFAQSALKWVLSNSSVSCLIISIGNLSELDEYSQASGKKYGHLDENNLKQWKEILKGECRIGCTQCESHCTGNIKISDILRFDKYFRNYNQEKSALVQYSKLDIKDKQLSACIGCSAPCESNCSYNVDIRSKLKQAHNNLSLYL